MMEHGAEVVFRQVEGGSELDISNRFNGFLARIAMETKALHGNGAVGEGTDTAPEEAVIVRLRNEDDSDRVVIESPHAGLATITFPMAGGEAARRAVQLTYANGSLWLAGDDASRRLQPDEEGAAAAFDVSDAMMRVRMQDN